MEGVRRGRMGRGKGRGVPLLRDVTVLAVMLCLLENLQGALAGTVYFNSYGHCIKGRQGQYFSLQDESYTLLATGAMEIHETLICMVTFQAPPDAGVCLTFRDYLVEDCGVSLDLYQGPTASGKRWVGGVLASDDDDDEEEEEEEEEGEDCGVSLDLY
ncbi:uncharacterized protein LOC143285317 [Babylonia areolata]|uniref:uncharacterized protein LOC143285317 n=1 Tax=Babylonia areolata TaxID=304850 RepID=UPI003FD51E68